MNDQWSGKTFRPNSRRIPDPPTRWSTKSVIRPPEVFATKTGASGVRDEDMLLTLPVSRSNGFMEVARGDQVALGVHCDRQLGERTAGRSEDNLALLGQVEG